VACSSADQDRWLEFHDYGETGEIGWMFKSGTTDIRYNYVGSILGTKTLQMDWDMLNLAAKTRNMIWGVGDLPTKTLQLLFDNEGHERSKTLQIMYDMDGVINKLKKMQWTDGGTISKTKKV
jgi:hypothetical protein